LKTGKLNREKYRTDKHPYDLCVKCALIILKHYLKKYMKVMSDGKDIDWEDAKQICVSNLGYGADFEIEEQRITLNETITMLLTNMLR